MALPESGVNLQRFRRVVVATAHYTHNPISVLSDRQTHAPQNGPVEPYKLATQCQDSMLCRLSEWASSKEVSALAAALTRHRWAKIPPEKAHPMRRS